jgi:ankyrin repeat protein
MLGVMLRLIENLNSSSKTLDETLIHAVTKGDFATAEKALGQGANPNAFDINDLSPLFHAIHNDDFEMTEFLIDHGADPKARNSMGLSPLYVATCYNDFQIVSLLIRTGVDADDYCDETMTPLMVAASSSHCTDTLRFIIHLGVDLDRRQKGRFHTAVMLAFVKGVPETFRPLIDANATFTEDQRCWCEIEQKVPNLYQLGKEGKLPPSVRPLFEKLNTPQLTVVPALP